MIGERLERARRLSTRDVAYTCVAWIVAGVVEVGLRTMRLPRLSALLGVPLSTLPGPGVSSGERIPLPASARCRLAASRRAFRHWPFESTCLRTSLVAGWMLRDLQPVLRIGVAKSEGTIKAHAWLEIEGQSLDPGSAAFADVTAVGSHGS